MISVIVPVYNVEKYLNRCIDSILNQTYKDFELILIDDESTDKSGDICDIYADNDNRIKVIHEKNSGVSTARNIGIEMSFGEYLVFVDSDDWLESNTLEILIQSIHEDNIDMVIYGYSMEFVNDDGIKIKKVTCNDKYYSMVSEYLIDFSRYRNNGLFGYCWNKMYKASIIKNHKVFFDKYQFAEDVYFNFKVLQYCNGIKVIDNSLYHYMHQSNSNLSKIERDELKVINQMYDKTVDFLKLMNIYEDNKEYVNTKYIESIMSYILNDVFKGKDRLYKIKKLYIDSRVKESILDFNSNISFYKFMYPLVRFNLPITTLIYIYMYKIINLKD